MARRLIPALAAMALSGYALADLADPTRPPDGLYEARPGEFEPRPELVVTSVILRPGASFALIGKRVVRVGDALGEGRGSRIDEQGGWVKTRDGMQHYKLLPSVTKRPAEQQGKPGKR